MSLLLYMNFFIYKKIPSTIFEAITFTIGLIDFTCFSFFTMVNKIAHNLVNINIMNIKVSRILNIS